MYDEDDREAFEMNAVAQDTALESNPFEALARQRKVTQLHSAVVACFRIVDKDATPAQQLRAVEALGDDQWEQLEYLAKLKTPASATTRALLLQQMRETAETWQQTLARLTREVQR